MSIVLSVSDHHPTADAQAVLLSAFYDARNDRLEIEFADGFAMMIPRERLSEVCPLAPEAFAAVHVNAEGNALIWENSTKPLLIADLLKAMFETKVQAKAA